MIVLSLMIASGRSRRSLRSKCTCRASPSPRPGDQWWGRNHADSKVGTAMGPPVMASATASSQNSGLPFSTDAALVHV
jgi:hypothetical protein